VIIQQTFDVAPVFGRASEVADDDVGIPVGFAGNVSFDVPEETGGLCGSASFDVAPVFGRASEVVDDDVGKPVGGDGRGSFDVDVVIAGAAIGSPVVGVSVVAGVDDSFSRLTGIFE
jgi:hypothetical protein